MIYINQKIKNRKQVSTHASWTTSRDKDQPRYFTSPTQLLETNRQTQKKAEL